MLHVLYQAGRQTQCSSKHVWNSRPFFSVPDLRKKHFLPGQTDISASVTWLVPSAFSPLPYNARKHWSLQDKVNLYSLFAGFFFHRFFTPVHQHCCLSRSAFFLLSKKCLRKKYCISPVVPALVSVFQCIWSNIFLLNLGNNSCYYYIFHSLNSFPCTWIVCRGRIVETAVMILKLQTLLYIICTKSLLPWKIP